MSQTNEPKNWKEKTLWGVPFGVIAIAFAVWTILGLSFGSESYLRNYKAGRILSVHYFIIEFLTEFYLYALFSIIVFKLGKKFPLQLERNRKTAGIFALHILFSVIFSVVNVFLGAFIAWTWEDICQDCLSLNMLIDPHFLHRGVVVYWGILIVGKGLQYYREMQSEKLRVAELSSQLFSAQLSALKMQIHPHFLFNTLNSIAELIQTDPDAAEKMIARLSNFLRLTLQSSTAPQVTLKEEFDFLHNYLDIEKVRFQERLAIDFVYEKEVLEANLPNLLLQPLVENSIKHGVSINKGKGYIKISARRENDRLLLSIEDNGKNTTSSNKTGTNGNGVGLKNVESRLKQIYGENFSFELIQKNDEGTSVKINIPFETDNE